MIRKYQLICIKYIWYIFMILPTLVHIYQPIVCCFNFIIIAIHYRQCHYSIESGWIITQESITHKFLGIVLFPEKYHYAKFIVSSIENQYHTVDFDLLQDVRNSNNVCIFQKHQSKKYHVSNCFPITNWLCLWQIILYNHPRHR